MTLTPKNRLIGGFVLIAILGAMLLWKHAHDKNISERANGVASKSAPVHDGTATGATSSASHSIPSTAAPVPESAGTPSLSQAPANTIQRESEIVNGALHTPKKLPSQVTLSERQDEPKLLPENSSAQVATGQPSPTPPEVTIASASASSGEAESDRARQQAESARQQAESARQQAESARASQQAEYDRASQQADKEKAELRAQLLQQLNTILATRDSARGLIANMSDVFFKNGSYELSPGARERLAKVSGIVAAHPGLHIEIEGHSDSVGNEEYNQQLSEERAIAVREYLVQDGIPPNVIVVRAFGKTKPIATNDTPQGRQQNRRVELILSGNAIDPNAQPILGTAAAPK